VTSLLNGSVIADSYVTFTADAPQDVVSSAAPGLESGAQALYQDSSELSWPVRAVFRASVLGLNRRLQTCYDLAAAGWVSSTA
jgi:hypothetical protein